MIHLLLSFDASFTNFYQYLFVAMSKKMTRKEKKEAQRKVFIFI